MKRELAKEFNQEVEGYRTSLLYYARNCDWETFEAKAGRLFDYVESIEFIELERRFFRIFNRILGILVFAVVALFNVDFEVHQDWPGLRNAFVICALAVSGFELYFLLDYRIYINVKTSYYRKRREKFIRCIKQDFSNYSTQAPRAAA